MHFWVIRVVLPPERTFPTSQIEPGSSLSRSVTMANFTLSKILAVEERGVSFCMFGNLWSSFGSGQAGMERAVFGSPTFDKYLSSHPAVDTRCCRVQYNRVEDVDGTKANRG